MTAEQRAAVERSEGSHVTAQELRDEARVIESPDTTLGPQIRSYVAAHFRAAADEIERLSPPSDDELPVTRERLRGVGFHEYADGRVWRLDYTPEWPQCVMWLRFEFVEDDSYAYIMEGGDSSVGIGRNLSWGSVRRLCSALGIELTATR